MVNTFLVRDIGLLGNFSMDNLADWKIYERIETVLEKPMYAGEENPARKFLEEHPPECDPQGDDPYSVLERRCLDYERGIAKLQICLLEYGYALNALDYKFSSFVHFVHKEFSRHDRPGLESLAELSLRIGVRPQTVTAFGPEKPQLRLVKG